MNFLEAMAESIKKKCGFRIVGNQDWWLEVEMNGKIMLYPHPRGSSQPPMPMLRENQFSANWELKTYEE